MAAPTQVYPRTAAVPVRPLIVALAFLVLITLVVSQWPAVSVRALALSYRAAALGPSTVVTLAPGATAAVTLRFRNDGPLTWTHADEHGRVLLGVRDDSTEFARAGVAVDWLAPARVAAVEEPSVAPGATATFSFTIRAPAVQGVYRMPLGLVVEGLTWFGPDDLAVVISSDLGFHGALVDQSAHPTVRAGDLSPVLTLHLKNTGTRSWVRGANGSQLTLGVDGDDRAQSALAYAWPTPDRVAIQSEATVEPGANATFAFRLRAPQTAGTYSLRLRPVVDGVTWLEGDAMVVLLTVVPAGDARGAQTPPQAMAFTYTAAASPSSVVAGETTTIDATFASATAASALLGVEIASPDGSSLVFQRWIEAQQLAAGVARAYPVSWQVPADLAPGTYAVRLRAFSAGWQTSYGARDSATTVTVTAATAPEPPGQGNAVGLARRTSRPTATASAAPTAAPSFTMTATASPATVDAGSSVTVDVTTRSATATGAAVTIAVYAPGSSLALVQRTFDEQTFAASQQRAYQLVWSAPANAVLGTYRVSVGVFAVGLTAQYAWSDGATSFAVRARSPSPVSTATAAPTTTPAVTSSASAVPTSTAVVPTTAPSIAPTQTAAATAAPTAAPVPSFTTAASVDPASVVTGGTVSVTALVTSTVSATALVDVGVYAPDGVTRVYQRWFDNEVFVGGQERSFSFTWTPPTGSMAGTYKVVVGVFTPHWGSLYTWLDRATFSVAAPAPTAAPTAAPSATAAPTATAVPTVAPTPTPAPTATSAASFSGLRVQGNALVNASGQTVVLHGVDRMGTEYRCAQDNGIFDGPSDQASVTAIKSWRTNAVRVPLNEHCWLGVDDGAATPQYVGETYRSAIDSFVNLLIANRMYVILDLHWSAGAGKLANDQDKMPNTSYSVSFWQSVASRFKDRPQVIFDLFNEPIPNDNANDATDTAAAASWQCWRDGSAGGSCTGSTATGYVGMQSLVTAVRGAGATNVIMLGGIQWANTIWSSSTRNILTYRPSDPQNNLIASLHIYQNTWCNTTACLNTEVSPVAAQMPVVAAEIGNTNCDATFMNAVMNWLDSKQLGYLAWVWNNYGATSCANIMLVLDYTGTPSVYGQIYKTHLALLP